MSKLPPKTSQPLPEVFINYRHEDTGPYAGWMRCRLVPKHFAQEKVFYAPRSLDPGVEWKPYIDAKLDVCDVMIVLIGERWLECLASKAKALEDAKKRPRDYDYVYYEIAEALRRPDRIHVIPLLVGHEIRLKVEDLPPALRKLARLNSKLISHSDFDRDVTDLVPSLRKGVGKARERRAADSQKTLNTIEKDLGKQNLPLVAHVKALRKATTPEQAILSLQRIQEQVTETRLSGEAVIKWLQTTLEAVVTGNLSRLAKLPQQDSIATKAVEAYMALLKIHGPVSAKQDPPWKRQAAKFVTSFCQRNASHARREVVRLVLPKLLLAFPEDSQLLGLLNRLIQRGITAALSPDEQAMLAEVFALLDLLKPESFQPLPGIIGLAFRAAARDKACWDRYDDPLDLAFGRLANAAGPEDRRTLRSFCSTEKERFLAAGDSPFHQEVVRWLNNRLNDLNGSGDTASA